jgi:autotransporter translocation and assembly factor TamB
VNSRRLNLDYLNHGLPVQEIDGVLTADLNLRGTLADPVGEGRLRLHGGNVLLPAYQTRLHDIDFLLRAEERRLVLDSLTVSTTRGSMRAGGTATWRLSPTPGFSDYLLTLRADNLLIADSRALRLRADADLRLTESAGKPLVQGKVAFMQARVNVDARAAAARPTLCCPCWCSAAPFPPHARRHRPAPKPACPPMPT